MADTILNFLESIKWWLLLAILIAGTLFIYWGDR